MPPYGETDADDFVAIERDLEIADETERIFARLDNLERLLFQDIGESEKN